MTRGSIRWGWLHGPNRKNQEEVNVLVVLEDGREVSLNTHERARYVANNLMQWQSKRPAHHKERLSLSRASL